MLLKVVIHLFFVCSIFTSFGFDTCSWWEFCLQTNYNFNLIRRGSKSNIVFHNAVLKKRSPLFNFIPILR